MMRKPQVAGQFYPADPQRLKRQIGQWVTKPKDKIDAWGLVCPHAGYVYSGEVAARCFSQVRLTKSVVILGPNHTGLGEPFSIFPAGIWQMPFGNVEIDACLAESIMRQSKSLKGDIQAHLYEHSIEVQLPFLQYFSARVKIVPIVIAGAGYQSYDELGRAIARALEDERQHSLIVASSDMTHYRPQEQAEHDDRLAIEAILNLDGQELLRRIEKFNISMCGYGPVACMLAATKVRGARQAELIKYQTSAFVSGDYSSVVGYAGIVIK